LAIAATDQIKKSAEYDNDKNKFGSLERGSEAG